MEDKKGNAKESNQEQNVNKIDNYKLSDNALNSDTLKDKQGNDISRKNLLIKENYDRTDPVDSKTDKNKESFEKRECSDTISDSYDKINQPTETENISNPPEKKINSDMQTNQIDVNSINETENRANELKESNPDGLINSKTPESIKKEENSKKLKESPNSEHPLNNNGNMRDYYKKLPIVIIAIGMAGSGKTTYIGALYNYLKIQRKKKVYTINLDPAVKHLQYPTNIDIRDSIKYHEVMKEYKLGPNGAIMTCLNLFATRFDKVIEILEKRKHKLNYIIVDTPGQIEVFNWSASGNIILETLSVSFPVVINYIIDTVRCERPITFMSNMLYACSILYKTRLPFLACFNKIDIIRHDKCIEWMKNYDTFNEDVLNDETYMASFSRSCALMINEFYEGIKTVGISSKTIEGFNDIIKHLESLKEEFIDEYVAIIEKQVKRIKKRKEKDIKLKMESLLIEKQKQMPISTNNNKN
ncbi:XPA binding protein 1, putative [Plasmodium chabaudi adami]|uniref:GPN-loop GTPase 1 n=1 Tax=Plasmodium chabaudi adami TaxID=5826 RepID=A0A1D3RRX2_PLACE|nr:XPA binding protein 1, putative [Plasmodium chabaudi adami]